MNRRERIANALWWLLITVMCLASALFITHGAFWGSW